MDSQASNLREALCARLCHDLAGQIGTIAGMIDLAAEDAPACEALSLAAETAHALAARIRFFRAAWSPGAGPMAAGDIAELAAGLPNTDRLEIDLSALDGALPEPLARVALCVLQVAAQAASCGGTVRLEGNAGGIVARLVAPARWPETSTLALSPREILLPLAEDMAREAGYRLERAAEILHVSRA